MLIRYSNEDIGALAGPSLNRAFSELNAACGFPPVVRSPYGGKRTRAQQKAINPRTVYSDHVRGRAVDIDNQRTIRDRIGSARFEQIMRKWGWKNQTTDGFSFPSEPWHFATHLSAVALAALTVKAIVTPNPKPSSETDYFMPKVIVDRDTKQKYRYAVWDGIFGFDFITGTPDQIADRVERKKEIIGQRQTHGLSPAAFLAELADVNANRAQAGLPEIVRPT